MRCGKIVQVGVFKNWAIPGLFHLLLSFQYSQQNLIFTYDWIRTANLWCRKQLLYQLNHNHCPTLFMIEHPEYTHLVRKGKYHCMSDLLFDQLGFRCFSCVELDRDLQV